MAPIYIMIDQEETGQNIQHLMHRKGLKVRDVQEACGLEKPQAVYKWIHGQSLPSIDNLLILAKIFGSTVEGILATSEDALPYFRKLQWMVFLRSILDNWSTDTDCALAF